MVSLGGFNCYSPLAKEVEHTFVFIGQLDTLSCIQIPGLLTVFFLFIYCLFLLVVKCSVKLQMLYSPFSKWLNSHSFSQPHFLHLVTSCMLFHILSLKKYD